MRRHLGCVAAALFAVPGLTAPLPATVAEHTEVVTLPLPIGEDGFEIKTLKLNFKANYDPNPCLTSSVTLNTLPLTQDTRGLGNGKISLDDTNSLQAEATWDYECHPNEAQYIHINVNTLNGEVLDGEVRFDVRIKRLEAGNEDPPIAVAVTPQSLGDYQTELKDGELIVGSEGSEETFFEVKPETQRQATLKNKAQVSTGKTAKPAKAVLKEVNITPDFIYGAVFATLSLLLLAVVLMSCLFCCSNYGAAIRQRMKERKQSRREKRAAARQARRAVRRKAVSDFFNSIFARSDPVGEDDEKRAMVEDSDSSDDDDDVSTVTDELAGLRSVADMVGDIVAAEEGRSVQRPGYECRHPEFHERLTPEFYDDDESLPAYEEQAPGSAVVADGFHYQGQTPMMSENSSDRLGYEK